MYLLKVLKTLSWALLIFFILIQSFVKDYDIDGREISFTSYEGFYFFPDFEILCFRRPHCDWEMRANGGGRWDGEWGGEMKGCNS